MIRTFTLRGWAALVLAAFAPPLTPVLAGAMPTLALVNETSSLPRGLYLRRFGADTSAGTRRRRRPSRKPPAPISRALARLQTCSC